MALQGIPTWCDLGAERMALVRFPPLVRRLVVFADPDPPGLRAAAATRAAHPDFDVDIRPPPGTDDYAEHCRKLGLINTSEFQSGRSECKTLL
ncbi:toprim domain-containing protein [Methylobacterium amylolyticum]|uniref:toprim domain-containing protein n=1 Tax=Methylobacterium sp. NEAU 140 TaxID=3064945 RepID=UPI002735721A|nr:toprim domain-containing protein [Methylobacterium sp. NEAU 140]